MELVPHDWPTVAQKVVGSTVGIYRDNENVSPHSNNQSISDVGEEQWKVAISGAVG